MTLSDPAALKIFVTTPDNIRHEIPALSGWSLMEIIRDAGLPGLKAECGGALSCATCHVYIDPEWQSRLIPSMAEERDMIADHAENPKQSSRLSCQIVMREALNGLSLRIASNPP